MRSKQFQMKSKTTLCIVAIAAVLQLGALAASAQTTEYDETGSETNVTLDPGTYIITAYGAAGGYAYNSTGYALGGLGAEMSAEFDFSASTNLTLLVGSYGGYNGNGTYSDYNGGGGGGGSFVVQGSTPLVVAGGGGGAAAYGYLSAGGGGTITTFGSAGGGNTGAGGGTSGGGGGGGDYGPDYYINGEGPLGGGAGGGGGFYTDGGYGGNNTSFFLSLGGSSFEDGGTGGNSNSGIGGAIGIIYDDGGFGGGGGGFTGGGVAGGGGGGGYSGGGGGGEVGYASSVGAGGGSIVDPSAIAILAEVPGMVSPDVNTYRAYGEIDITAVPEPASVGLLAIGSLGLLRRSHRRRIMAY